jgi:hypothetical protein
MSPKWSLQVSWLNILRTSHPLFMLHACSYHWSWLDYPSDMLWRGCRNVCGRNWRFAAVWKEIDNKEKTSLLFSQVGGWGIKRYNSFRTPAYKHPNHGINFARRFLQYILLKSAYTVLRVATQTALCIKEDGVLRVCCVGHYATVRH